MGCVDAAFANVSTEIWVEIQGANVPITKATLTIETRIDGALKAKASMPRVRFAIAASLKIWNQCRRKMLRRL